MQMNRVHIKLHARMLLSSMFGALMTVPVPLLEPIIMNETP